MIKNPLAISACETEKKSKLSRTAELRRPGLRSNCNENGISFTLNKGSTIKNWWGGRNRLGISQIPLFDDSSLKSQQKQSISRSKCSLNRQLQSSSVQWRRESWGRYFDQTAVYQTTAKKEGSKRVRQYCAVNGFSATGRACAVVFTNSL